MHQKHSAQVTQLENGSLGEWERGPRSKSSEIKAGVREEKKLTGSQPGWSSSPLAFNLTVREAGIDFKNDSVGQTFLRTGKG